MIKEQVGNLGVKLEIKAEYLPINLDRDGVKITLHRELTAISSFSDFKKGIIFFIVYEDSDKRYHVFYVCSKHEEGHSGIKDLAENLGYVNEDMEIESGGIINTSDKNDSVEYIRDSDLWGVSDKEVVMAIMDYQAQCHVLEVKRPNDDLFLLRQYK